MMQLKLLNLASNKGVMGENLGFIPEGIKGIPRIYNFVKGYWWQLSLWEFSDAQTEREQHRSHPSPDSTMAATPREPPSLHLCRQGQLLVTERGCEESQGIILFLSHSGTSLIDAWGVFLQNTPPWSRGRSFDFSWLKPR